uniref:Uncharacterized protein n=1 Tax=Meloidogyne javanica TaxID=6303 RepID=A0A915N1T6_MELJA
MHSHMSRVSSKQERMMLTEQEKWGIVSEAQRLFQRLRDFPRGSETLPEALRGPETLPEALKLRGSLRGSETFPEALREWALEITQQCGQQTLTESSSDGIHNTDLEWLKMELREEEDLDEAEMNLSTIGALSPMILAWTAEWEALVEEELKREYKEEVTHHQELLMDIPIGSPTLLPPLKQEPLSVVFVGPETGTQAAATNYIQNANNFDYSPPHQNPPQYPQQENEHWMDGNFEENNTIWQQQENNEQQQYFNSEGHYQNYQQPYGTFIGEEEYIEDMGTR